MKRKTRVGKTRVGKTRVGATGSAEAGQALVETLFVFPLFLLMAVGALAVGQSLRAKERARAWERASAYAPAAFDPEERRVARWPSLPATVEEDARRRKRLHEGGDERESAFPLDDRSGAALARRKRQAGSCEGVPDRAGDGFCYEGTYDAHPAGVAAVRALGPSRWTKSVLGKRSLPFEPVAILGDLAVTPYWKRAARYSRPLLAARAASLAESSPTYRRPLLDSAWDRGRGFHLDQWLGTRKVDAEETDFEQVYVLVAKKARSGQIAMCALEAWSESYFVGALWEAFSTSSSENEDAGAGCQKVARLAKGVQAIADGLLRAKAMETLAQEACGDAQALGGASGSCALGALGAQTEELLGELSGSKSYNDYAAQGTQ